MDRRVLIYNIDTADPPAAREAALRLCAQYDTTNYARIGSADSQSTPPPSEDVDFEAVKVFVPSALPLVPAHMLAIVTFSDVAGAERAAAALHGTTFAQRSLSVGPVMIEYVQTLHVLCPRFSCPSALDRPLAAVQCVPPLLRNSGQLLSRSITDWLSWLRRVLCVVCSRAFAQRQRFTKMFGRNAVATYSKWWEVFECR